ncbi:MAG: hypothetical protein PHH83_00090 [Patescibacteria group bacterium]|nr:hypothetical protein [Patescibacteria group bacterium]
MPRAKKTQDIAPVIIKQSGPKPIVIVIALIITAIFVGGIVFFGQQRIVNQNKEELEQSKDQIRALQDQLDQLQNVINSGTQTKQEGKKYYNEKYGFSLTILKSWNKYSTEEKVLTVDSEKFDSVDVYFEQDQPIFNIAAIDKDKWEDLQKSESYKPVKLTENDKYVFSFSFHKDAQQPLVESLRTDIEKIVSTFQFEQIPQAQLNIENCSSDKFSMKDGITKLNIAAFNDQAFTTTVNGCFHTLPDVLKTTSKYIYIGIKPEGVGGYILYGKYVALFRVNLENSKSESIFGSNGDALAVTDIDFSSDNKLIVYKVKSDNNDEFVVKNLETLKDTKYKLPVSGSDMQFGNFKFSPDASKIAIAIGYGPDKEHGSVYTINLSDKKFTSYQTFDAKIPYIDSWKDEETLNLK